MPLRFLTAGESHGPAMIAILEGMPAGLHLPNEVIDRELARRQRGYGAGPRMKIERDRVRVLSGVLAGITTGAPIALMIENLDHDNWAGKSIPAMMTPRPGHADLTGAVKYGYSDLRLSLERASARETSARVAVGAVCKYFLTRFGIQVGGYVVSIGGVEADLKDVSLLDRAKRAEESEVRCPDDETSGKIKSLIEKTIKNKDTLGGIIEVFALNLPPGLGSHVHWDRRLGSRLGAAVLGIQAIKGFEIGNAFENSRLPGTLAQDAIYLTGDMLERKTNRAGGIEGGITNGEPLIVRAAMKPIATTLTPQDTVDLGKKEETQTNYERSDFCPVPRAVPIVEAVISIVLADALIEKLGGDSINEMLPRYKTLSKNSLTDLPMEKVEEIWWPD